MSIKILGFDYKTYDFNVKDSKQISNLITIKKCKFCNVDLNLERARYYQHNGGWKINTIKEKVWIWFECSKCNHGWSLNRLGVNKRIITI